MINSTNYQQLSDNLEDIVGTPVSIKLIEKLTPRERASLVSLIYKWTRGEEVLEIVKSILNSGKSKMPVRQYHGTAQYNKLNQ